MTTTQRPLGRGQYLEPLLSFGDFVIVNLLFWLTIAVFPQIREQARELRELWLLVSVSFVPAMAWTIGRRHEYRALSLERLVRSTFFAVVTHGLFFLSLIAFLGITSMPGRAYVFYYGLMAVVLPLFRLVAGMFIKNYRRRGFNYTRVVIIGSGPTAIRLYESMQNESGFGYRVLGVFDNNPDPHFPFGHVRPIDELGDFVEKKHIRQIFFTLSGHNEAMAKVIKIADDHVADFYYVPQIPRILPRRFRLHNIGALPVLSLRPNPLQSVLNRALKRSFDIAVSSVFLLFYPLVYIPVAIAIKMSSPGPVYFRQERTGYLGDTFKCLKFRTMKLNANSDKCQATQNDPRKTRVGDFLRRTSIDELPQFINVWRGDMSIVGPRPHMLKHTEDYTRLVDSYMVRHAV
ncbi:MAG: exopolysaccharide biosynthesis polyprenyl glycosylphosphotransferase, partial [Muribaculaceae bacterium]|nr:exopolysaccharide biosynthesis polyprenyl glycosylphosphotransferase [Muribaculaceae bacterium]